MRLTGTLAFCLFLSACASSGDGDNMVPDDGVDGGGPTEPAPPDDTVQPQMPSADAPTLTIDEIEAATDFSSVPVSGKGPAGGTIIIVGDTGRAARGEIDANGAFCLDVVLAPEQVNTLKVQAVDNRGHYSQVVEKKIEQKAPAAQTPVEEEPAGTPQPVNVAAGAYITTNMDFENGSIDSLLDGSTTTGARFSSNAFGSEWIQIILPEIVDIEKITISGSAECHMESVLIQVTTAQDIAFTDYYRNDDVQTPTLQAVSPLGKMRGRWVAVTPTGYGCNNWGGGTYDIKEISVWAAPSASGGGSTPAPTTDGPSCSNR